MVPALVATTVDGPGASSIAPPLTVIKIILSVMEAVVYQ
jgi:hypothetical protein